MPATSSSRRSSATSPSSPLEADGDVDKLGEMPFPGSGRSVSAELTEAIAKIGENMNLRRSATDRGQGRRRSAPMSTTRSSRAWASWACSSASSRPATRPRCSALGKQLAMHIANTNPLSVSPDDIDPAVVARSARSSPSRSRKAASRPRSSRRWSMAACASSTRKSTLLAQTFVIDGESKVQRRRQEGREGRRRADQGDQVRALRAGRGHREGRDRLRCRSRRHRRRAAAAATRPEA